jgi:hypothetical protein
MWNVKRRVDTVNNRGNWNHFHIVQNISGQHAWKAGHQGITGNSYIGHWAHTSGSATVKVQEVYHAK